MKTTRADPRGSPSEGRFECAQGQGQADGPEGRQNRITQADAEVDPDGLPDVPLGFQEVASVCRDGDGEERRRQSGGEREARSGSLLLHQGGEAMIPV